jgi:predicted AlkP superfamily phosphohydrolase/phosphomutase
MNKKVFIFGIDGAPPDLILKWMGDLPNIKKMAKGGIFAKMETVKPPTSIAAWTSFFSGRDPGETGIYNYTARYHKNRTAAELINSRNIKADMAWDILGKHGKKSIILGVISSNPVKKINGIMLSGLLTPNLDEQSLYPYELKQEILDVCGGKYMFDVLESFTYRKFNLDELVEKVYEMTDIQLKLVKHFLKTKEWDFFAYTLMGSDRLHHRLWRYIDEGHINYESHPKYSRVIKDYYCYLDKEIGEVMALCPKETIFMVASDHGMGRLDGRINLNDWLAQRGYLSFKNEYYLRAQKEGPIKFDAKEIDWEKTKAFAASAYEALIFINKEAVGDNYNYFCDKLSKEIAQIPGKDGKKLNTQVFKSADIYSNGFDENAPDLIAYFDNLFWGTNCDIGNKGLYSLSNLVGADDALHGKEGIFILSGAGIAAKNTIKKVEILDVAPTILSIFNLPKEYGMKGSPIDCR